MSSFNNRSYTNYRGINLNSRNGCIRFDTPATIPSTTTGHRLLYVNASNQLVFDSGASTSILGTAGSVASFSLNDAYDDGYNITVDSSAVTLAGSHATNNVLALTYGGSGTGNMIDIQNSSSGSKGSDIIGSGDTWSVSATGAALLTAITGCDALTAAANLTLEATSSGTITIGGTSTGGITVGGGGGTLTATTDIVITGSADTDVFTITDGDALVDDGQLTITESDTATYALNITSAGTGGGAISVLADDLTSGSLFYGDSNNEASFSGDGGYLNLTNNGTSVFKVQRYGAATIAGNAGSNMITITAGDVAVSDGSVTIADNDSAPALSVTNTTNTTSDVVIFTGDQAHTGVDESAFFNLAHTGCAAGDVMTITANALTTGTALKLDSSGTLATTGSMLEILADTATSAAGIIRLSCDALTSGKAVLIDATGEALTSGELLTISNAEDGDLATKTGNLVSITSVLDETGASNVTQNYDVMSIARTDELNHGSPTYTAQGSVLKLKHTSTQTQGTMTDSAVVLEVEQSGATALGDAVLVTSVGVGAKALNIVSGSTTVSDVLITGSGVKSDNKAVLDVTSSGATAAGGSIVRITNTGTPAATTSYLLDIDYTGATEETNDPICVHIDRGQSDGAGIIMTGSVADEANSGIISMFATQTGATGVVMHSQHTSTASAAVADAVFTFKHEGLDSGNAVTEYCRVEAEIMNKTAGAEDGRYIVSCAADDSTLTQMAQFSPRAGGAVGQVIVGASGANGYVTSLGAGDLILDTNEGSSSSSITITDGANGDISFAMNGTSSLNVQNLTYETNAGSQVTTTATLTWGDAEGQVVFCTSTGGAYSITLPAVATVGAGGWYTFIKNDAAASAITLDGNSSETIDGSTTYAGIDADYDAVTIITDGTEWFIVSRKLA